MLNEQLEQTTILLEDTGKAPKQVIVDLGYRGVDKENPNVEIIHRGKYKSLTRQQRGWLKRRQAVLCAAGYDLRWLLRAMVRLGLKATFLCPLFLPLLAIISRTMRIDEFRQSPTPSFVTNVSGIR